MVMVHEEEEVQQVVISDNYNSQHIRYTTGRNRGILREKEREREKL